MTNGWEAVGRSLLRLGLEDTAGSLAAEFTQAARRVGRGEELSQGDVRRLYDVLDEAEGFVDEAAIAAGSNPRSRHDMTAAERVESEQ